LLAEELLAAAVDVCDVLGVALANVELFAVEVVVAALSGVEVEVDELLGVEVEVAELLDVPLLGVDVDVVGVAVDVVDVFCWQLFAVEADELSIGASTLLVAQLDGTVRSSSCSTFRILARGRRRTRGRGWFARIDAQFLSQHGSALMVGSCARGEDLVPGEVERQGAGRPGHTHGMGSSSEGIHARQREKRARKSSLLRDRNRFARSQRRRWTALSPVAPDETNGDAPGAAQRFDKLMNVR
jgi:hypothetical protein